MFVPPTSPKQSGSNGRRLSASSSLFHSIKTTIFAGAGGPDPEFESCRNQFSSLNTHLNNLKQHLQSYCSSMKGMYSSSFAVSCDLHEALTSCPPPHPYQSMILDMKRTHTLLTSERGEIKAQKFLDETALKRVLEELNQHKELFKRIEMRMKYKDDFDYYRKKLDELSSEKEKKLKLGKTLLQKEVEKYDRNVAKLENVREIFVNYNRDLLVDLQSRWNSRLKVFGPVMDEFIKVEREVAKIYSEVVNDVAAPHQINGIVEKTNPANGIGVNSASGMSTNSNSNGSSVSVNNNNNVSVSNNRNSSSSNNVNGILSRLNLNASSPTPIPPAASSPRSPSRPAPPPPRMASPPNPQTPKNESQVFSFSGATTVATLPPLPNSSSSSSSSSSSTSSSSTSSASSSSPTPTGFPPFPVSSGSPIPPSYRPPIVSHFRGPSNPSVSLSGSKIADGSPRGSTSTVSPVSSPTFSSSPFPSSSSPPPGHFRSSSGVIAGAVTGAGASVGAGAGVVSTAATTASTSSTLINSVSTSQSNSISPTPVRPSPGTIGRSAGFAVFANISNANANSPNPTSPPKYGTANAKLLAASFQQLHAQNAPPVSPPPSATSSATTSAPTSIAPPQTTPPSIPNAASLSSPPSSPPAPPGHSTSPSSIPSAPSVTPVTPVPVPITTPTPTPAPPPPRNPGLISSQPSDDRSPGAPLSPRPPAWSTANGAPPDHLKPISSNVFGDDDL